MENCRFLLIRCMGLSGRQASSFSKNKPSPALICIHVAGKYIPLYSADRDISVKSSSMLKSGHKQRERCREGLKHPIKAQNRTEYATEIIHLSDMVLIRDEEC